MSLVGQTIGNYRVTRKLGEGGMGAVYLGEHPLIGKKVAIKVLLEELAQREQIVQRFFNEAKAVNDIGHQNIVDIVDFGRTPAGLNYFIMEYLDGESLASRLSRVGLSFDETRHIILQCCSALSASHDKRIVHRDLKPENIHLMARGADPSFVKILDFGIAKLHDDGSTPGSLKTRTGMVIGTPAYMSPEQCEGKGRIDHRSDIYSLGVVMYELITGRVPFLGEGFGDTLVLHLTQLPTPPSVVKVEVPPALEAIVLRALEKHPDRRFQTMREFAEALADPARHLEAWRQRVRPPAGLYQGSTMVEGHAPVPRSDRYPAASGTTLSGAAAEVSKPNPTRSSPLMALLVGLSVFVLGGAGLLVLKRGTRQTTTTTPSVASIAVRVESDPIGATVERAGQLLGDTPLVLDLRQGDPGFAVTVRAPGRTPITQDIATDTARTYHVVLPTPAVPAPPPVVIAQPAPAIQAPVRNRPHPRPAAPAGGGQPSQPPPQPWKTAEKPAPAAPPEAPPPAAPRMPERTAEDDGTMILKPDFAKQK